MSEPTNDDLDWAGKVHGPSLEYWYAPGMYNPYWWVTVEEDGTVRVAGNSAADTDMGNLYGEEFHKFFPNAFQISEEQYEKQTIDPVDGLKWAKLLWLQKNGKIKDEETP